MKEERLTVIRVLSRKHQPPFCFQILKGLKHYPSLIPCTSQDCAYQLYPYMYQFQAAITDFMNVKEKNF